MCKKRGFELPEFNSPRWLSIENLFGEEWKDVKSLKGLYAISNYGRLKSHKRLWKCGNNTVITKEETIAKTSLRKNRYISYRACIDGKLIHVVIQRLVAENFLDNPLCLPFVNHKDENPSNNCVDNLEWCTAKYNSNYGTCQQRREKKLKDNMCEMWHEIHQYSLDSISAAKEAEKAPRKVGRSRRTSPSTSGVSRSRRSSSSGSAGVSPARVI